MLGHRDMVVVQVVVAVVCRRLEEVAVVHHQGQGLTEAAVRLVGQVVDAPQLGTVGQVEVGCEGGNEKDVTFSFVSKFHFI